MLAGRYAIEREIGRGGMGTVYLARDLRHFREVAVKVFTRWGPDPDDGSERFLQEIKIAARLSHPNILPLHDSGDADGLLYYVMPFVPGETLRQRLDREGALPVADALGIAIDVAGALGYAHSHGIIHRDIKPENILFIAGHAVVADFGIARAISAGGREDWKVAGPVGTPTYMSPEQAQGGSRVDGRSDLYSLGCVLYETLTGEPPFRGKTPQEIAVQHLEATPPPVQSRRPTLLPEMEVAVGRALAKHPADRYQTAQQMAEVLVRLREVVDQGGSLRVSPAGQLAVGAGRGSAGNALPGSLRRWAAPAFAAAGIAFAIFWSSGSWPGAKLDPKLHLVGPFLHGEGIPARLDGDQCSRLIHQALGRWQDLELADSRWTQDQLARLDGEPKLNDLLTIAKRARAGRLLSGEAWPWGDSIKVRGALYDVRRGQQPLREYTVTIAGTLEDAEQKFAELADSLLLPEPQEALAVGGIFGTHLIRAWEAYDSGHAALAQWDLPAAADHFRSALALDPQYGQAHLWLAQTLNWQGEDPDVWREHAVAGVQAQPPLPAHDRAWGEALVALAEGRYQDACNQYDVMVKRDTLDFQAWYGRGECRAKDRAVLKDPAGRSGWRFRASYHTAIKDYRKALVLVPSTHRAFRGSAFQGLVGRFFAEPYLGREGVGEGPNAPRFGAYPELIGDTVAFVPYPVERLWNADSGVFPATTPAAVDRNREALRAVTTAWTQAFPSSPEALEAHAYALEALGELSDSLPPEGSALAATRRARALASKPADRVRLQIGEVRLLLKLERWREARTLAESVLTSSTGQNNRLMVASVAAILGRPRVAALQLRQAASAVRAVRRSGDYLETPLAAREASQTLLAFAALGAPLDSIQAIERRLVAQLPRLAPLTRRKELVQSLLDRPQMLTYFELGPRQAQADLEGAGYLLQLEAYLSRGETAKARALLRQVDQSRTIVRPGDVALDATFVEGRLLLALGDTAGVVRKYDAVLSALPTLRNSLLDEVTEAAALPRMMALRSELAARLGDRETAAKWGRAVVELWSGAEAPLQDQVQQLHR